MAGLAEVRDLGVLVHVAADAVADEAADDREALELDACAGSPPRCRRGGCPGDACSVPSRSAAFVVVEQVGGPPGRPARPERSPRASATQPSLIDADVERQEVAALQLVGPGDPVDDHRVRRGADRAGKAAVALERRLGVLRADEALGGLVELARWSTPGRTFEASIRRQRTRISPAAAILSSCSGVLRMIIRYMARDVSGRTALRGPPPSAASPAGRGSARRPRPAAASPSIRRSRPLPS